MRFRFGALNRALRTSAAIVAAVVAASFTLGHEGSATQLLITLTGVARDFATDHPDFGDLSGDHGGLITGIVSGNLSGGSKPEFTTNGRKVIHEATDASGRSMAPHLADTSLGDTPADMGLENRGGVDSETSFAGWFVDQPGVNLSTHVDIAFQPIGGGVYAFDTKEDPLYSARGGFFPIDGMLYGNERRGGRRHNYTFSFELHAGFTYRGDMSQFIEVAGNSEIWVYIDGGLVIDLGGIRPSDSRSQYFDLSRLGLGDGSEHTISIFIANRHRGRPSFRLETNLLLENAHQMSVTPNFD